GSHNQWSRQGSAEEDRQASAPSPPLQQAPSEARPWRRCRRTSCPRLQAKLEDTPPRQPDGPAQSPELAAPLEAPAGPEAAAQQSAPAPSREPAEQAPADLPREAPEEGPNDAASCAEESDEDTLSDEEYLTYTTSVGEVPRARVLQMERDDGTASAPVDKRPSLVLGGLSASLLKRRGLELGLSDDWRRSKLEEKNARPEGPKIITAAVLPTESSVSSRRLRLQQPMPGAFPHHRTVIFMDWDDTLCPTTWIRNLLKEHLSEQWEWAEGEFGFDDFDWKDRIPAWFNQPLPDLPHIHDSIAELQLAVIDLIKVAQTYGVVCIVTNAVDGWVLKTCKKWLPKLKQYINGHGAIPPIAVLYGQQEYLHRKPHPASPAASLPFVDSQGELMLWKLEAFAKGLEHTSELYRTAELYSPTGHGRLKGGRLFGMPRSPKKTRRASSAAKLECGHQLCGHSVTWVADRGEKDVVSVVSIGDSEAEMQAGQLAVMALNSAQKWSRRRARAQSAPPDRQSGHPWIKNVKLEERPTVEQMIDQLRRLRDALPGIVAARSHMRLEPPDIGAGPPGPQGAAASAGCGARLRWCEQLPTQIDQFARERVRRRIGSPEDCIDGNQFDGNRFARPGSTDPIRRTRFARLGSPDLVRQTRFDRHSRQTWEWVLSADKDVIQHHLLSSLLAEDKPKPADEYHRTLREDRPPPVDARSLAARLLGEPAEPAPAAAGGPCPEGGGPSREEPEVHALQGSSVDAARTADASANGGVAWSCSARADLADDEGAGGRVGPVLGGGEVIVAVETTRHFQRGAELPPDIEVEWHGELGLHAVAGVAEEKIFVRRAPRSDLPRCASGANAADAPGDACPRPAGAPDRAGSGPAGAGGAGAAGRGAPHAGATCHLQEALDDYRARALLDRLLAGSASGSTDGCSEARAAGPPGPAAGEAGPLAPGSWGAPGGGRPEAQLGGPGELACWWPVLALAASEMALAAQHHHIQSICAGACSYVAQAFSKIRAQRWESLARMLLRRSSEAGRKVPSSLLAPPGAGTSIFLFDRRLGDAETGAAARAPGAARAALGDDEAVGRLVGGGGHAALGAIGWAVALVASLAERMWESGGRRAGARAQFEQQRLLGVGSEAAREGRGQLGAMAQKYRDRIAASSGISCSRAFESDFGKRILMKYGWKEGEGLGRRKHGRTDCLQAKRREQKAGLGAEKRKVTEELWDNWWADCFNSVARNISVNSSSDDGTGTKASAEASAPAAAARSQPGRASPR
ncbi:unnamed protein product, partial [Prorocentrum cordatum]